MDLDLNKGQIGRVAKELLKAGYTVDQVKASYSGGCWWYKEDWRGQKGQSPLPADIAKTIMQSVSDPQDVPHEIIKVIEPDFVTDLPLKGRPHA